MEKILNELFMVSRYLNIHEYHQFMYSINTLPLIPTISPLYYFLKSKKDYSKIMVLDKASIDLDSTAIKLAEYGMAAELERMEGLKLETRNTLVRYKLTDDIVLLLLPITEFPLEQFVNYGYIQSSISLIRNAEITMETEFVMGRGLVKACEKGYNELVELLLTKINPSFNQSEALAKACKKDQLGIVQLLLNDGRVDIHAKQNQAFINACIYSPRILPLLHVDCGFNLSEGIRMASEYGNAESVKYLIDKCNPGDNDNYAIINASKNGHLEIVKVLLKDSRVDPTVMNNLPLKLAQDNFYLDIVDLLMKDQRVLNTFNDSF
ncbi:hypothetical protein HDV01_007141 [Terramyces sp. JEL0728]|nr:hypothetical protein HDV01_007141 [Terramyces sp. JEL0728]